jgi:carboxypeptidase Taq
MGAVGYFPTYTLGNLYSAQFYRSMSKDIPEMWDDVRSGNYNRILDWLRVNIHSKGKLYSATDLVKKVTGESLNEDYFVDYIKDKYGNLYDINL